jgi:hypothetical protein
MVKPRPYIRDVHSGDAKASPMLHGIVIMLFNKFQLANHKFFPRLLLIHGGARYPFIAGSLTKTPTQQLDLSPGDRVRIKSREQFLATLDSNARNRGLSFDAEMLSYCGSETRVLSQVDWTHAAFANDNLILEGVVCKGQIQPSLSVKHLPVLAGDLARTGRVHVACSARRIRLGGLGRSRVR